MDQQAASTMANTSDTSDMYYEWDGLEPVPTKYAYSGMVLTVVFFQILNKIVGGGSSMTDSNKLADKDFWKWKNLYISWIHAMIVGLWDISCFVLYPEMFQDLVAYHNMHIYSMICFTTGYFFYDFMDICLNNMAGKMWEVLVHHVAVASVFFYNCFLSRCLAYNVIALTVEVNSAFLHARKLLQMSGIGYDHLLYRVVKWANLVTFVLFRFGALIAIFYGMCIWAHRVTRLYYCLVGASSLVMLVINCVLFKRLLGSDVFRKTKSDGGRRVAENGGHGGEVKLSGGNGCIGKASAASTNNNDVGHASKVA